MVEKHYSKANGYEHDAEVVYGDTDSVMVLFGCKDLAKAMELGEDAANRVTTTFLKPIKLEFEKVCGWGWECMGGYGCICVHMYICCHMLKRFWERMRPQLCSLLAGVLPVYMTTIHKHTFTCHPPPPLQVYYPYLLISKKRYAGLLWTNPDKYDKMDTKGIETVRRDNCLLVRNVVSKCLEKILIEQDEQGAIDYVKNTISDLLMNRLDLSLLVITKGLTQDAEDYATRAPHVEVAKKMQERDPATAPSIGDRVAYVNIKAHKGAKVGGGEGGVHMMVFS